MVTSLSLTFWLLSGDISGLANTSSLHMTLDMSYFLFRSGKLYWNYLLQLLEMPKSSLRIAILLS
jgi:hypothetical protein